MSTFKRYLPAIIVFILCNISFFTPGYDLPQVGDWFGDFSVDKLIHTGFFGLMSLLFMYAAAKNKTTLQARNKAYLGIALIFCGWGVAVEFIQLWFIPGRSFSVMDMLADALGAVLAYFFARIIFNRKIAPVNLS